MNKVSPPSGGLSTTLVDVLRDRAELYSERDAYLFLRHGSAERPKIERLTYGRLLVRAKVVAGALQRCCDKGDRVLILAPPGLDYITAFFGCQLAGVVAVPAYPPRNSKHMDRLAAIAGDCGAAAVLSVADRAGKLAEWGAGHLPEAIAVDALPDGAAGAWRDVCRRGVMVGHDNLLVSVAAAAIRGGCGEDDTSVNRLPPYHDFGLVGGLLQPIFAGFRSVMMAPAAFLHEPSRWIRALSDHGARQTIAPNFGYELACRDGVEVDLEILDLSLLGHAVSGGEPPRASTLDRFARRFAPAGFRISAFTPGYGLAETTLQVTQARECMAPRRIRVSEEGARTGQVSINSSSEDNHKAPLVVSNGPTIHGHDLRIVDPETCCECPAGAVGEIWVTGPTVAHGYWNRLEQTSETFQIRLIINLQAGPFLRTGDLGVLADGELYGRGRIKELIIICGHIDGASPHRHLSCVTPGGWPSTEARQRVPLIMAE
jgi:acyl-CoA synthetase (AMP-forming)/AMP-acid ligase II